MYLIRFVSVPQLVLFGVMSLSWGVGGWLLVRSLFSLKREARFVTGLATGWLLFITITNLAAHWMELDAAFWISAVAILLAGGLAALRARSGAAGIGADLVGWKAVAVLAVLTLFFWRIERGLAIFDEFLHLPLVSVMAAGDIPPHFYLNPSEYFAYHYGLQVWAANLVRSGGLFPWSAFDLARSLALALTAVLGWVWFGRVITGRAASYLAAGFAILAGGSRWLLLLLPHAWLVRVSSDVVMTGSGRSTASSLLQALASPWTISGGGPIPFPFAFHNAIFVPALMALGSDGALPLATVFLLLVLFDRRNLTLSQAIMGAILLASLALSAEHLFAALWVGILAAAILIRVRFSNADAEERPIVLENPWILLLVISGLLALFQGGFITETARSLADRVFGGGLGVAMNDYGFGVRWPPGLPTAHYGDLSLLDPRQLVVLLAEIGPGLVALPIATAYAWRQARRGHWVRGGLGLAALLMFGFALFATYGVDRSMTRFPATALWLWVILAVPVILMAYHRLRQVWRLALVTLGCVLVFSGVVDLAIQMTAMTTTQYTYYVTTLDTYMSARYWNKLTPDTMVLDQVSSRSVTLFGRPQKARSGIYQRLPSWAALVKSPAAGAVASAGYAYVYFDPHWWGEVGSEVQASYAKPCVRLVNEVTSKDGDFRRLYDVSACGQIPN